MAKSGKNPRKIEDIIKDRGDAVGMRVLRKNQDYLPPRNITLPKGRGRGTATENENRSLPNNLPFNLG